MCGIAGIIEQNNHVDLPRLKSMTDAIAHRGPDGEGHWINAEHSAGLGHRRLSIIDLSDHASQPMRSHDGRYTIVFNGEIYNYIELKEQLLKEGHSFKTTSDTEVLLKLYELKKENCLPLLEGMFAIAIWDDQEKTLFCARDRFGEKPFFYHHIPGRQFVFGSEMKAIFATGIRGDVNNEMLYNFINSGFYITSPTDRSETFYSNIRKLPPAHYLIVNRDLQIHKHCYWQLNIDQVDHSLTLEQAEEKFRELFYNSIKRRLRSDVPVGSSLSGGLDSSSIVCVINDLNKDQKIRQNTFSARFQNFHRDEGYYIQQVIDKTNVQPYFTWPDESKFLDDFDKLLYHQEEPFPSASIYAQYCVMQKAKEEGITVLLDGQGADEILAGYEYYLYFHLKRIHETDHTSYRQHLQVFKDRHKHLKFEDLDNIAVATASSPVAPKSMQDKFKDLVRPAYKMINPGKYRKIHEKIPVHGFFDKQFTDQFTKTIDYDFQYHGNSLNGYLKHSVMLNNLEDLLRFCDRNSMAHSREVRLPFLSHDFVEFCFTLPDQYKINQGWTKYILRDSMKNLLPEEVAWRVDKVGYEPPQAKWMKNEKVVERTQDAFSLLQSRHIIDRKANLEEHYKWPVLTAAYLFK